MVNLSERGGGRERERGEREKMGMNMSQRCAGVHLVSPCGVALGEFNSNKTV